jgi:20S proteasome subunit beta 2
MIKRQLELHRFNTHSDSRVYTATQMVSNHVFRYGGNVGTHLIIGGVDVKGPQLMEVDNGGNVVSLPYLTMGSGCLAAMGIFESQYRDGMNEEEAKNMCIAAIEAGIYHDLGSGSNVDVCVMKKGKHDLYRNIKSDNKKMFSKPGGYSFDKDKLTVLAEYKQKLHVENGPVPMDLS